MGLTTRVADGDWRQAAKAAAEVRAANYTAISALGVRKLLEKAHQWLPGCQEKPACAVLVACISGELARRGLHEEAAQLRAYRFLAVHAPALTWEQDSRGRNIPVVGHGRRPCRAAKVRYCSLSDAMEMVRADNPADMRQALTWLRNYFPIPLTHGTIVRVQGVERAECEYRPH